MNCINTEVRSVVIVNAYGRSNRGDAVLLDECMSDVFSVFPNAHLHVALFEGARSQAKTEQVSWSERIGNASGLFSRIITVLYLVASMMYLLAPWLNTHRVLPACQQRTLLSIKSTDVIVSAPGGYIHDTNFAFYIALFHIYLGAFYGKTILLAPQSIGPVRSRIARFAALMVLRRSTYICTRERYSYSFLRELGVKEDKLIASGDSAFWSTDVEMDQDVVGAELSRLGVDPQEQYVGMTVVDWNFPHHRDSRSAHDAYVKAMVRVAEYLATEFSLKVVIFNQVTDDLPTARLVADRCKALLVVDQAERDPRMLRALIGRSRIFVGTRFHSCIFALVAGRPTVAISYLPKTQYILEDLGLSHSCVSIDDIDENELMSMISHALSDIEGKALEVQKLVAEYKTTRVRFREVLMSIRYSWGS